MVWYVECKCKDNGPHLAVDRDRFRSGWRKGIVTNTRTRSDPKTDKINPALNPTIKVRKPFDINEMFKIAASAFATAAAADRPQHVIDGLTWVRKTDEKTGRIYFFNTRDNKSQWEEPSRWAEKEAATAANAVLEWLGKYKPEDSTTLYSTFGLCPKSDYRSIVIKDQTPDEGTNNILRFIVPSAPPLEEKLLLAEQELTGAKPPHISVQFI